MTADISVIVPVFNGEEYLRACLDSIVGQTIFDSLQVILVDDGSTDTSSEICDEYALRYKNITVIHQANCGVSSARNAGLKAAESKYIGFADSDDMVFPEMYEFLSKAAEQTGADLSFCAFEQILPDGKFEVNYPFLQNTALGRGYIEKEIYEFLLSEQSLNSCWNKLYKRELIEKADLKFIPGQKIGEDRKFNIDCFSLCQSVCYVPKIGYLYRPLSSGAILSQKEPVRRMAAAYKEDLNLFSSLGVERAEVERFAGFNLLNQALSALDIAFNRGESKKAEMKTIILNEDIQYCLKKYGRDLKNKTSRYNRWLLKMMEVKSVTGVLIIMTAMKIKIALRGKRV